MSPQSDSVLMNSGTNTKFRVLMRKGQACFEVTTRFWIGC